MMVIDSAGLTDVGRKRVENQDCFLIEDDLHLYVVADGMGGHLAGKVAGQMVVDAMRRYFLALTSDRNHPTQDKHDDSISCEANHLLNAIFYANAQVYQASIDRPDQRGMGSTVAALLFTTNSFIAANVGDSSIYLIHAKRIECLSVPHTVVAEQNALALDKRTLHGPAFKHMLTRGIGIEAEVEPDFCESQYFEGDRFVICSDGLSDKVSPPEILDIAVQGAPQRACRTLIDLANARGGDDNITVIILTAGKPKGFLSRLRQRFWQLDNPKP